MDIKFLHRLVVLLCISCAAFFTSLSPSVSTALSSPGGSCLMDSRIKIHADGKQIRLLFIMFVDVTHIETLLDFTYIEPYPHVLLLHVCKSCHCSPGDLQNNAEGSCANHGGVLLHP